MTALVPLPTLYRGVRFRSRLEARWAFVFTELNIPWQYEAQGYDLGDAGWYLPDFWFPGPRECHGEVKPHPLPEERVFKQIHALAQQSQRPVMCFFGSEPRDEPITGVVPHGADEPPFWPYNLRDAVAEDGDGFWSDCPGLPYNAGGSLARAIQRMKQHDFSRPS